MNIGFEFRTDKGVGTVLGETSDFIYSLHLSPEPMEGEEFDGDITIITALKTQPEQLINAVRLNDVVMHSAQSCDLVLNKNHILFTASECDEIGRQAWQVLIHKYRIGPTELIQPNETSDSVVT